MLICWQKSLANSVRAGALLGTFVGCFQGEGKKEVATETVHKVYINIIRALGCFLLFSFSFVLAKLASRAMSVRYHQKAYFQKMHDALQKVNHSPLPLSPSPPAFYATPSFNIHIEQSLACNTLFSDEASRSLKNRDPRQVGHDVSHEVGHQLWLWDQTGEQWIIPMKSRLETDIRDPAHCKWSILVRTHSLTWNLCSTAAVLLIVGCLNVCMC